MVTISVAVPTFNRASMLRDTMEKLLTQQTNGRFTYEVVVVDDGSTDNTRDVVEKMVRTTDIPVRYVYKKGQGYQYALNTGIENAQGAWIAFCDDDELPEPEWLFHLYDTAVTHEADIVGGMVKLNLDNDTLSKLGPLCRSCLGETPHIESPVRCNSRPLPGGGNILIKRTVIDEIGGINTEMKNGGCDKEFVMRALEKGCIIWKTPYSAVYHRIPGYRLKPSYFRWVSARYGSNQAYRDITVKGAPYTVVSAMARLGALLVIHTPLLVASYILPDFKNTIDIICRITISTAYIRSTLSRTVPSVFKQKRFFSGINFRSERTVLGGKSGEQDL